MVKLYELQTDRFLGEITEAQFGFLASQLEEESLEDQDYYLNRTTVEMLDRAGGDPSLIALLRQALGDKEEMDIRWIRD